MATEVFHPELWHEFFVMVGGGAAAMAGLVFVAMSVNLDVVARDATHRYRAIGTLAGFTSAFMICAFGLMGGQGHQAVGVEWLLVAGAAAYIYLHWICAGPQAWRQRFGVAPGPGNYRHRMLLGTDHRIGDADSGEHRGTVRSGCGFNRLVRVYDFQRVVAAGRGLSE